MTDTEWIAKLDADFGKLQRNRQQVPLEKLETTYAKSYKALIGRLTEAADWFADRYLQTLMEHWPRHPKDTAGNEWLEQKVAAIIEEENQAGGLRDKWRLALVAHLDREEFEQLVYERYARCEQEAFDPYWQRHNHWTGEPGNRWIYNDILRRFWLPPGRKPDFPQWSLDRQQLQGLHQQLATGHRSRPGHGQHRALKAERTERNEQRSEYRPV